MCKHDQTELLVLPRAYDVSRIMDPAEINSANSVS